MVSAVLVATEANRAFRSGGIVVTAVTQVARPMLLFGVQARELFHLMACRARGHARDARRPVGAMTGAAAGTQLPVWALLLRAMAIRTSLEHGKPRVRLVTIRANLMPLRRGLLFGAVTTTAGRCLFAGVGFVTADAARMALFDEPCFTLMAVVAADFVGLGVMRQALVAVAAGLVPLVERDLLHARRVAPLARRDVAQRELETVRFVATRACGLGVCPMIGGHKLVTRCAGANVYRFRGARRLRVRIMAAHAVSSALWVVRVNTLVARRAGGGRGRQHIVRRVAVRAAVVRRDGASTDHVDLRVAVAARRGFFLFERMRLVTTGAGRVPADEQRRGWDDRLLLGVTRATRPERILRGCVTVFVTGRASFDQGFAL